MGKYYYGMIPAYKTFHISCSFLQEPIAIKINFEDHYIRVMAPIYEVIHFQPTLFNQQHLVVSNLYGIPLFHVSAQMANCDDLHFQLQHHRQMNLVFDGAVPAKGSLRAGKSSSAPLEKFQVIEQQALSPLEKQMIGAAIVACQQHMAMAPMALPHHA